MSATLVQMHFKSNNLATLKLQQLMEEVKMLKDSVQQETEEKNKLQAAIMDKDVCLEKAVADTDRLKAQLAEKEEQVGFGL